MIGKLYSNGIYFDTSSKSTVYGSGRNARHASYRAEVVIYGKRIRKRFKYHSDAEQWIADMIELPVGTFNKKIEEKKCSERQLRRDAACSRWERENGFAPRFEDHVDKLVEIRGRVC